MAIRLCKLPLILAHGCYWRRCTFCDTSLPYVAAYRPQPVERILEKIQIMVAATGCRRFHFVDEACPPNILRALSRRLVEEGIEISWHGNIRCDLEMIDDKVHEYRDSGGEAAPRTTALIARGRGRALGRGHGWSWRRVCRHGR